MAWSSTLSLYHPPRIRLPSHRSSTNLPLIRLLIMQLNNKEPVHRELKACRDLKLNRQATTIQRGRQWKSATKSPKLICQVQIKGIWAILNNLASCLARGIILHRSNHPLDLLLLIIVLLSDSSNRKLFLGERALRSPQFLWAVMHRETQPSTMISHCQRSTQLL